MAGIRRRLATLPCPGWRWLGGFWAGICAVIAAGGVTLQMLGPMPPEHTVARSGPPDETRPAATGPAQPQAAQVIKPVPAVARSMGRPGRDEPGPIPDPDPALLEPSPGSPVGLPIVSADGRLPMHVYAAGFDRSNLRPRVGLIVAGIGLNGSASEAAIRDLPGGVTLAISPYASDASQLLTGARLAEHEYLLSVPMEPQGYPLNDPGPHALMTTLAPEENNKRLAWALGRIGGYAGVTNALGAMHGERFAGVAEQMEPVLAEVARRGLLFVDARPEAPAEGAAWSRSADLVIDDPGDAASIDAKLAELDRIAKEKGSALGLAGAPRSVTLERIALWTKKLAAEGLALAPVSALVQPPGEGVRAGR